MWSTLWGKYISGCGHLLFVSYSNPFSVTMVADRANGKNQANFSKATYSQSFSAQHLWRRHHLWTDVSLVNLIAKGRYWALMSILILFCLTGSSQGYSINFLVMVSCHTEITIAIASWARLLVLIVNITHAHTRLLSFCMLRWGLQARLGLG